MAHTQLLIVLYTQLLVAAAQLSLSAIPPTATQPENTTTTTPSCTSPTGFGNTVVPGPDPIATPSFLVDPSFAAKHEVFLYSDLNAVFPRAAIASFCLDQCVQYRGNATTGSCMSFEYNLGKPDPPKANGDNETRWFCSGFDVPLSKDIYVPVDIPGSYEHPEGVNRVCDSSYRDY